jgi:hypothetical protein
LEAFIALTALAEAMHCLHAAGDEDVEEQSTVSMSELNSTEVMTPGKLRYDRLVERLAHPGGLKWFLKNLKHINPEKAPTYYPSFDHIVSDCGARRLAT